jgi:hypothetical protein
MTQAEYIIQKFGGINAMAAKLGHRNASTVQGWKKRGTIPPGRYVEILAASKAHGIQLAPDDFVHHLRHEERLLIALEEVERQSELPLVAAE